jgi:hypothetical protein
MRASSATLVIHLPTRCICTASSRANGYGGGASPPLAIPPDIERRGRMREGREVESNEIKSRGDDRNTIPTKRPPHSHLVCVSDSLSVRLYRDRNERGGVSVMLHPGSNVTKL